MSTCPSEREWDELAAGLIRDEQALAMLDHASGCDRCAELLRGSLDIFQSNHDQATAAEPVPVRRRTRIWIPLSIAAMIVAGVGLAALYYRAENDPLKQLAIAYTKVRPIELRIPGAAFGTLNANRGVVRPRGDEPAEMLRTASRIARELERDPRSPLWLHAKGRLNLLEWNPADAEQALRKSHEAGNDSAALWIDLATASYESGTLSGDRGKFVAALGFLDRALLAEPENPAALYNRALVLLALKNEEAAADTLRKLLRIEARGPWSEESRRKLAEIRP